MSTGKSLDLETIVDVNPMGRLQVVVITFCALAAMLDGFDTQSIAFVAPELVTAWKVEPAAFGPVFGIGLFGGMIGAIAFGAMGDRFGRKPMLVLSILVFSACSLITPLAGSMTELAIMRLVTGFGLGGAIPNFIALTAEYTPKRLRITLVSLMFCGFPLGAALGGVASAKLIAAFGWKSVFIAGGVLPLLILPLLIVYVPESVRFLAVKDRRDAVLSILRRMNVTDAWNGQVASGPIDHGASVSSLFRQGRGLGTALLWATFFLSLLLTYFLLNWIPLIVRSSELGIENAILAVAMLNFGALIGCLTLGWLADRLGQAMIIAWAFAFGAVAIALIGHMSGSRASLFTTTFLAGFFSIGAQMCTVALCAGFYETFLRTTGIGWSMAVGRIGAIAGPLVGGILIAGGSSPRFLFIIAGITSFFAALTVSAIGRLVGRAQTPQLSVSPTPISS